MSDSLPSLDGRGARMGGMAPRLATAGSERAGEPRRPGRSPWLPESIPAGLGAGALLVVWRVLSAGPGATPGAAYVYAAVCLAGLFLGRVLSRSAGGGPGSVPLLAASAVVLVAVLELPALEAGAGAGTLAAAAGLVGLLAVAVLRRPRDRGLRLALAGVPLFFAALAVVNREGPLDCAVAAAVSATAALLVSLALHPVTSSQGTSSLAPSSAGASSLPRAAFPTLLAAVVLTAHAWLGELPWVMAELDEAALAPLLSGVVSMALFAGPSAVMLGAVTSLRAAHLLALGVGIGGASLLVEAAGAEVACLACAVALLATAPLSWLGLRPRSAPQRRWLAVSATLALAGGLGFFGPAAPLRWGEGVAPAQPSAPTLLLRAVTHLLDEGLVHLDSGLRAEGWRFTLERYQAARAKLAPGGAFAQLLRQHDLGPAGTASVFRTFAAAFPHVLGFEGDSPGELLLLGSATPLLFDLERAQTRLRAAGLSGGVAGLFARVARCDVAHPAAASAPLQREARPGLELPSWGPGGGAALPASEAALRCLRSHLVGLGDGSARAARLGTLALALLGRGRSGAALGVLEWAGEGGGSHPRLELALGVLAALEDDEPPPLARAALAAEGAPGAVLLFAVRALARGGARATREALGLLTYLAQAHPVLATRHVALFYFLARAQYGCGQYGDAVSSMRRYLGEVPAAMGPAPRDVGSSGTLAVP